MRRLEEVRQMLDELCAAFVELKKYDDASQSQEQSSGDAGESSSYLLPDAKVFGRDDVRELILSMILVDSANDDQASAESSSAGAKRGARTPTNVLPIVGMSGVGKTTLAQVIYSHQDVKEHFPQRAWVYVSEHFSFKRTLQEILCSLQGNYYSSLNCVDSLETVVSHGILCSLQGDGLSFNCEDSLPTVVSKLCKAIRPNRRLFLVLDNVWDDMCKYRQTTIGRHYCSRSTWKCDSCHDSKPTCCSEKNNVKITSGGTLVEKLLLNETGGKGNKIPQEERKQGGISREMVQQLEAQGDITMMQDENPTKKEREKEVIDNEQGKDNLAEADMLEEDYEGIEDDAEGEEKVQLEGSEEYMDSQESYNSFPRAVGVKITMKDKVGEETRRVCSRLKAKEDKKALETAIDTKEAQNAFINKEPGGRNKKTFGGGQALKAGSK